MESLKNFQKKSCERFLKTIFQLKEDLNNENFINSLEKTHKSISVLLNSFNIPIINTSIKLCKVDSEKNENLEKYNFGIFNFFVYKNRIIDVEPVELADLFVNKKLNEIEKEVILLQDYKERPCDLCGQYFLKPYYETPRLRIEKDCFCFAYHEGCYDIN